MVFRVFVLFIYLFWFLCFNLCLATPSQCPDGHMLSPEPKPPAGFPESLLTSLWYLLQMPTEEPLGNEDLNISLPPDILQGLSTALRRKAFCGL